MRYVNFENCLSEVHIFSQHLNLLGNYFLTQTTIFLNQEIVIKSFSPNQNYHFTISCLFLPAYLLMSPLLADLLKGGECIAVPN